MINLLLAIVIMIALILYTAILNKVKEGRGECYDDNIKDIGDNDDIDLIQNNNE